MVIGGQPFFHTLSIYTVFLIVYLGSSIEINFRLIQSNAKNLTFIIETSKSIQSGFVNASKNPFYHGGLTP